MLEFAISVVRVSLDEEVIDGVYAAAERVFDRQHGSIGQKLRDRLEGILKLLARHRMCVRKGCQDGTLAVGTRHALIRNCGNTGKGLQGDK